MPQTFDRETLQNEYEDTLFRLLMADYARAEGEAFLRENEELQKDPANLVTPAEMQAFQRLLDKIYRKRAIKAMLKDIYRITSKAALFIVLAFALGIVSTVSVQAIRINVLNFLVAFEEGYASIQLGNGNSNGIIGDRMYITWKDAYVPTYIPDGFEIIKISNEPNFRAVDYMTKDGRRLTYFELSADAEMNLDTENADRIETTNVQDFEALMIEKNGNYSITWATNEHIYLIMGEVTEEDLFKIAEGVKFLEK